MSLDPITAGIDLITSVIGRLWPDKSEDEKAQLALALAENEGIVKLMSGQLNVDAAEASNESLFVSGWRPCVGWVCALAFSWQFILLPILLFIGEATGHHIPVPQFDFSTMSTVLMGMLGLGSLRTYEKITQLKKK